MAGPKFSVLTLQPLLHSYGSLSTEAHFPRNVQKLTIFGKCLVKTGLWLASGQKLLGGTDSEIKSAFFHKETKS